MAERIGWQTACPKCLATDIEKVGWSYWYCASCSTMFELVFGKPEAISVTPAKHKGKALKKKQEPTIPMPGQLDAIDNLEFPLL